MWLDSYEKLMLLQISKYYYQQAFLCNKSQFLLKLFNESLLPLQLAREMKKQAREIEFSIYQNKSPK